jgi:RND family efflux transporter MFP subunit
MTASTSRAVLILCLAAAGCGADGAPQAGGGGPGGFVFPVTFIEAATGEVRELVTVVGDVETRQRARLAFERSGRLTEVLAEAGDTVAAGAVLARMDDAVLRAEQKAAAAAVTAAQADAQYAANELKRAQELGTALADSERDRWVTESAVRTARVAEREAEVARLDALLEQSELRAPFAGLITERNVTIGTYAILGLMAFEMVDLANLELRLEIPASFAAQVSAGDVVTLQVLGSEKTRDLPLHALLPSADASTRTFRGIVRVDAASAPGLRPGMFVRASLPLRRGTGIRVPIDALLESPQGTMLVIAEPGSGAAPPSARFVAVRVLAREKGEAAVEALEAGALAAGAQIVVTGSDNVFPGAPLLLQAHRAAL